MNLPNLLTLIRIFLVPVVVAALLVKFQGRVFVALGIFLAAALTDLFDGYIARKKKQITRLGILLDPIADKLLTASTFIALVELRLAPAWAVVIIVGREIAVTGIRAIALSNGIILAASSYGKTKMLFEIVAISLLILSMKFTQLLLAGKFFLYATVALALISAADYLVKFMRAAPRGGLQ